MTDFRSMIREPILKPDGSITVPGGATYARTPERIKRRTGNAYVASGAVVVTDIYPEGMTLHIGPEAEEAWSRIAPRLMAGPHSHRPADFLAWSGHVYEADSGLILLLLEGTH